MVTVIPVHRSKREVKPITVRGRGRVTIVDRGLARSPDLSSFVAFLPNDRDRSRMIGIGEPDQHS